MKLFDIDWLDFIQRLSVWQRLSLKARRAFAELRADQGIPTAALDGQDQLLVESGLISYREGRHLVRLEKAGYPFARVIHAMCRHDILRQPDCDALLAYLHDHFTNEELRPLMPQFSQSYGVREAVVSELASVAWVEKYLARTAERPRQQLSRRSLPSWLRFPEEPGESLEPPATLAVGQAVVRHLMASPEPMPLRDLPGRFPDIAPRVLAGALLQGIRELVLFPAMRLQDMTPVLSLWPTITRRLHRPRAKPPEPVQPERSFHGAFLMEDMTTVLVAAASGPLRLRGNDLALFAKAQRELESSLMPLPGWLNDVLQCPVERRVTAAAEWLRDLGPARSEGTPGEDLRLEPTHEGKAWLAQTSKQRLKTVLDHLRDGAKNRRAGASPRHVDHTQIDD